MATTTYHDLPTWELEDLTTHLTRLPDPWHITTGRGWQTAHPTAPSIVLTHPHHGLIVLWPAYHPLTYTRDTDGTIVATEQPDPTRPPQPLPYDPLNLTRTIAYHLHRQITRHTGWTPGAAWGITSPYYTLRDPHLALPQTATTSHHQLIDIDILEQPDLLETELVALAHHCNPRTRTPANPDQWNAALDRTLPSTVAHDTRLLTPSRRMRPTQERRARHRAHQMSLTDTRTEAAWTGDVTTGRHIAASLKTQQLRTAGHRTLLLTPTWHTAAAHRQLNPDNQPRTIAGLAYQALTRHGEDGSADQAADQIAHRPTRTGYNPPTLLTWTLEHTPFSHHHSWGDLLATHTPDGPQWQWDAIVIDNTQHLDPDTLAYITLLTTHQPRHLYLYGDPHHPNPHTGTCTPPPWDNQLHHTDLTTADPPLHHPHLTHLAHQIHPHRTPTPTTPDTTRPDHTLLPAPTPPDLPTHPRQRAEHRNRYRNTIRNRLDDTIEQLTTAGIRTDELTLLCDNTRSWHPVLWHHHTDGHPDRPPHRPTTTHPHLHNTTPYYTYTRTTPHTHLPVLTDATAPDANPHTTLILLGHGSATFDDHLPHHPAHRRQLDTHHQWRDTAHTLITATRTTSHLLTFPDHPLTPFLEGTGRRDGG